MSNELDKLPELEIPAECKGCELVLELKVELNNYIQFHETNSAMLKNADAELVSALERIRVLTEAQAANLAALDADALIIDQAGAEIKALKERANEAEATIKEWQDAFVANTPQDYFDGIRPNDCPKGFEGVIS